MRARKLNKHGLHEFEAFIVRLRSGQQQNTPKYLLTADESSSDLELDLALDADRQFSSRYDLGCYLVNSLKAHDVQKLIGDRGFWSWIALLWFEQLCPKSNGVRSPSKEYNYVLSESYNHRPRHAIYMTWQLVRQYGEDSRFMLCKPLATRGEITEQLMARQEILSSEGAVRLASRLYFDPSSGSFKRGAAARKSTGCVARYVSWLQQLQMTFDIFSTTADDLMDLLPKEFDRFRSDSVELASVR